MAEVKQIQDVQYSKPLQGNTTLITYSTDEFNATCLRIEQGENIVMLRRSVIDKLPQMCDRWKVAE